MTEFICSLGVEQCCICCVVITRDYAI